MRSEFFALANANETQRSSATLSGMSGRQNQKKQADGAGKSGNSIDSINAADSSGGICRLITMRVI